MRKYPPLKRWPPGKASGFFLLAPFSEPLRAADTSTIVGAALLVFLVAFAGAWLLVARQGNLESRSVKILVFSLYFWALVFAQTAVGGLFSLIF